MLARRIIPSMDLLDGQLAVPRGSGTASVDLHGTDPVELARFYYAAGADELLFRDTTATLGSSHSPKLEDLLDRLRKEVFLPFLILCNTVHPAPIRALIRAGADRVVIGAPVFFDHDLLSRVVDAVGSERVVVIIEARPPRVLTQTLTSGAAAVPHDLPPGELASGHEVVADGKATGCDVVDWAREAVNLGAGELLLLSQKAVEQAAGFDLELTQRLAETVRVPVVAMGGATRSSHFVELFKQTAAQGAVAAGIFHSRDASLQRIKRECLAAGIPVRWDADDDAPKAGMPDAEPESTISETETETL